MLQICAILISLSISLSCFGFDELEYSNSMDNGADYFEPINFSSNQLGKDFKLFGDVIIDYPVINFSPDILNAEGYKDYEVIIVVNKAIKGASTQTMNVYHKGQPYSFGNDSYGNPIYQISVSTGRIYNNRSVTPRGYFTPTILSKNHKQSKTGVPMPFAVFFYGNYGIHRVPYDYQEEYLGQAVSAGCVRVSKLYVPQVYNLVEKAGKGLIPVVKRNGELAYNKDGTLQKAMKYKTLVIVQEEIY